MYRVEGKYSSNAKLPSEVYNRLLAVVYGIYTAPPLATGYLSIKRTSLHLLLLSHISACFVGGLRAKRAHHLSSIAI